MAERRMFAKTVIDSDAFLDMPASAQALYFHLNMRADDDGFVNNPRKIQRVVLASDDDFKLLIAKHFIIIFESGVIVIKHWKIHNYIQSDRYRPTVYLEEKAKLLLKENKAYSIGNTELCTECIQDVSNMDAQVRLGKDRDRLGKSKDRDSICRFAPPTQEEIKSYCLERKNHVDAERFFDFYEAKGWMVGKNKMKDWKASVRTWEKNDTTKAEKSRYREDDLPNGWDDVL